MENGQKEKKFISLVVYLHNVEAYVKYFLNAVIPVCERHFQEFEIVCVDDCSEDNSRQILQEYAQRDNRIIPIYLEKKAAPVMLGKLPECVLQAIT